MDAFAWSDRFLTGESVVDDEHRELVRIINWVGSLQARESAPAEVARTLDELVMYAVRHFSHEEELMTAAGCDPRHVELHRRIHQDFARQIGDMRSVDGGNADTEFLLRFLTNWLVYHILGTDQAMARQVRNIRAGMAPAAAFEAEQANVPDPANASLLDALNSLYRVIATRNQALTDLNQLLTQIVDGDPVPTLVLNAQHQVTHWNKACAVMTRVPAEEMVGSRRQWAPFYPQERPLMADLIVDGVLEAGVAERYAGKYRRSPLIEGAFEAEDFFPHFGDGGCWLHFTAAPLRDAQGKIIGAIETLQDVTERHQAVEELRRYQAQLEELVQQRTAQLGQARDQLAQSEKLASIGQLAAGVAHEINNPIGFVHSNIGTLEKYVVDLLGLVEAYEVAAGKLPEEQAAAMRALHRDIDTDFLRQDLPALMRESKDGISRVRKIVQDLKDFSRVDSSQEWQWADLHRALDSTVNIVANEVRDRAEVVKDYGTLPEVECMPSQLNQVFLNLLVNAAHAMGSGMGRITIRTGVAGDHVWVEFADNGSGVPEEIRQKIFDPFFTTKPVGQGTGLGLSLSYGIVQRHQGRIELESEIGKGSTFRVILPIRQAGSVGTG